MACASKNVRNAAAAPSNDTIAHQAQEATFRSRTEHALSVRIPSPSFKIALATHATADSPPRNSESHTETTLKRAQSRHPATRLNRSAKSQTHTPYCRHSAVRSADLRAHNSRNSTVLFLSFSSTRRPAPRLSYFIRAELKSARLPIRIQSARSWAANRRAPPRRNVRRRST